MADLFEVKNVDKKCYQDRIRDFLPENIIDIHTHVWLDQFKTKTTNQTSRSVTWPRRVAKDNSIEDLFESYKLMFPDKHITPMIFSTTISEDQIDQANTYIHDCAQKYGLPALLFACPGWSAEVLEKKIKEGNFLGIKVYLSFSPAHIAAEDIEIFDFLPHHQLEMIDRLGLIVMLHIPRKNRLKDPVNLKQILEIHNRYKDLKLIIAHVGRAYCRHDVGDAFNVLSGADRLLYDFSANTNQWVFEELIRAVGPTRILFGSDMPILRMRMKRIEKDGHYVNLVPQGLYGDVSNDKNMAELTGDEAENLTFFMYEEIDAFRRAAEACSLSGEAIEKIFFQNSAALLNDVSDGRPFRYGDPQS